MSVFRIPPIPKPTGDIGLVTQCSLTPTNEAFRHLWQNLTNWLLILVKFHLCEPRSSAWLSSGSLLNFCLSFLDFTLCFPVIFCIFTNFVGFRSLLQPLHWTAPIQGHNNIFFWELSPAKPFSILFFPPIYFVFLSSSCLCLGFCVFP